MNFLSRWQMSLCVSALVAGTLLTAASESRAVDPSSSKGFALVEPNAADQPRKTPITRAAMKQYLEDLKDRAPRIPLPELSAEEQKLEQENPRQFGYEARLRKLYLDDAVNGYLTFGGAPAGGFPNLQTTARPNPQDPALTLDYGFKVRLFWIAARANNCQYCLGHQESKLLAVGMQEDDIAALDSNWLIFPEKERVAFTLAKRLTLEPHLFTAKDLENCRAHYSDLQLIEMLGSIAGNNAINRWKEGTGVPQMRDGGNFGRSGKSEHSSYLTKTSDEFATKQSSVVRFEAGNVSTQGGAATVCKRPPLLTGEQLAEKIRWAQTRTPRLPLVEEAKAREVLGEFAAQQILPQKTLPQWQRLLAHFPVAGKRLVGAVQAAEKSSDLDAALQAKINWVTARQDRAWYLTAVALKELQAAGVTDDERAALDGDWQKPGAIADQRQQSLLVVARNLASSPITLTDAEVAHAVKLAGPRAVTQTINYTCYPAAMNRITEGAGLAAGE
ncbi:MAG: carboxymuconolactone decarboxylase family protein [Planctomycetota bacterium]